MKAGASGGRISAFAGGAMRERNLDVLERVEEQVRKMAALAVDDAVLARRVERVSRWSIGEQLEHLAITSAQVVGLLGKLESEPDRDAERKAHPVGRLLLALNWIPRGVGKAPDFTRPQGVQPERLREQLGELAAALERFGQELPALSGARGRFRHPRFGWLDLGQWLRFLEVHQHHHLKIVAAIARAAR